MPEMQRKLLSKEKREVSIYQPASVSTKKLTTMLSALLRGGLITLHPLTLFVGSKQTISAE
jgi:hypothetical protein